MSYYKHRTFSVLLLMVFLSAFLAAGPTVTATYTAQSPIYLEISPGVFTHPTVIGAKLGRFAITSPNNKIYTPAFVNTGEVAENIQLTGLYKNWEGGAYYTKTDLNFKVISVAYPSGLGGTPILQTIYGGRWPVISWNAVTITANPFYVDLYLVNTNSVNPNSAATLNSNGQYYRLDTPYTFTTSFNPIFSLAVADNPNTDVGTYAPGNGETITSAGSYVVTNGLAGPNVTPILDSGSMTAPDGNGFYYGDGPTLPSFAFAFTHASVSFDLEEAYGGNRATINQAQLTVINGVAGTLYSQMLTFTDTSTATTFQLFPTEGSGQPIEYQLFLGADQITKGSPIHWQSLNPGMNTKDLKVGGIVESDVAAKVSGSYTGTITVTITNPN
ncbi:MULTISPECIES: hypothetical protein [unclassified Sphaerochaeta]|uniref:hypothetical protein n=1 Tax=unclassified Sphaerochaeta TaxID=2637943 RepID=UPI0025EBD509|nr:hypothetical protein [Sphaerochaeta sp. UBA5856]MCK9600438.1 hypothetical protein [Sphaerochaeta sp.]